MPTRQPPHKLVTLISAAHRMRMVEVACEGESDLVANDVELLREGTTYTVDTMRYLHQNRRPITFSSWRRHGAGTAHLV